MLGEIVSVAYFFILVRIASIPPITPIILKNCERDGEAQHEQNAKLVFFVGCAKLCLRVNIRLVREHGDHNRAKEAHPLVN